MRIPHSPDAPQRGVVIHRYFPEWADLPETQGTPVEADRNSYSAGGYAEEFGYRAQLGQPSPAPTLEGDPESSRQWRELVGGLHPGYPECSSPSARDRLYWETQAYLRFQAPDSRRGRTEGGAGLHPTSRDFKVIWLDQRRRGSRGYGAAGRLTMWWRVLLLRHRKL